MKKIEMLPMFETLKKEYVEVKGKLSNEVVQELSKNEIEIRCDKSVIDTYKAIKEGKEVSYKNLKNGISYFKRMIKIFKLAMKQEEAKKEERRNTNYEYVSESRTLSIKEINEKQMGDILFDAYLYEMLEKSVILCDYEYLTTNTNSYHYMKYNANTNEIEIGYTYCNIYLGETRTKSKFIPLNQFRLYNYKQLIEEMYKGE